MKQQPKAMVVHAEALHDGDVLITFADAICALYSSDLLRSILPLADCFVDHELKQIQETIPSLQSIPPGFIQ